MTAATHVQTGLFTVDTRRLRSVELVRAAAKIGVTGAWCLIVALAMGGCPGARPTNQPPQAEAVSVEVDADGSRGLTLVASDPDGNAFTFVILSLPNSGVLSDSDGTTIATVPHELLAGGAQVHYAARPGFVGDDSFTFAAKDAAAQGAAATVTVRVVTIVPDVTFDADQTLPSLTIEAGTAGLVSNNAVLTITGDAKIDGTLYSQAGRIRLNVTGALVVNGTVRSVAADAEVDDDAPADEQGSGILFLVGAGGATFNSSAVLNSTGPIVVSDDPAQLTRTPAEFFDEVENVADDSLPTLVPLPPDDPVFLGGGPGKSKDLPRLQGADLPPIVIGGTWPPVGAAAPRGDRPLVVFRVSGPRSVNLDGWTFNGPAAPAGESADGSGDSGPDATGARGRNGMRLNIWNDGGAINIVNAVSINLPGGGDGGDATTACASAIGGPGGNSGNLRITASAGIDISNGTLTINPGRGGRGGNATVAPADAGADGCPGEAGRSAAATGGKGGDNLKRLLARGNVVGLENVAIGALFGGDGGDATALACDGGAGLPCCDGGAGGAATATAGAGGNASLSVTGLDVATGPVFGGDGGEATAVGGYGDEGGDCKLEDGGDGGVGGAATAIGGSGGSAATSGAGGATGGNGGDADASGGDGDDGGDSGLGDPGAGGAGGLGLATAGTAGGGIIAGAAGVATDADGNPGLDGGGFDVTVYCFELGFLVDGSGGIFAGTYEGVVTDPETGAAIGTLAVEFVEGVAAGYLSNELPIPHIGISDGQMVIDFSTLGLEVPPPGPITGIRLEPLYATNVSAQRPIRVEALNADDVVLDTRTFEEIPDNQIRPETPTPVDAEFELDVPIAAFRIVAPNGTFITLFRFYLVDP